MLGFKYKSTSAQVCDFLKTKDEGYEFTNASLIEDMNTTPSGEWDVKSIKAVAGYVSALRAKGAVDAFKMDFGKAYTYRLVDRDLISARNATTKGGVAGRKRGHHPEPVSGYLFEGHEPVAAGAIKQVAPEYTPEAELWGGIPQYVQYGIATTLRALMQTERPDLSKISTTDLIEELYRRNKQGE